MVATGCGSGGRSVGVEIYEGQRYAGARLLGEIMKPLVGDSGPILLVSRGEDDAVLPSLERGLRDGLEDNSVEIVRVEDVPENPEEYLRPTPSNIGLVKSLATRPDTRAVVVACRLFDAKELFGGNRPPFFAFDWSVLHLPSHTQDFESGLFRGGVLQRDDPRYPPGKSAWRTKAEAMYVVVNARGVPLALRKQ